MQAVRLNAVVGADRCQRIEIPEKIPIGEVELIVLASQPPGVRAGQPLSQRFAAIDGMPHQRLTKEEVDSYLAEERATWD